MDSSPKQVSKVAEFLADLSDLFYNLKIRITPKPNNFKTTISFCEIDDPQKLKAVICLQSNGTFPQSMQNNIMFPLMNPQNPSEHLKSYDKDILDRSKVAFASLKALCNKHDATIYMGSEAGELHFVCAQKIIYFKNTDEDLPCNRKVFAYIMDSKHVIKHWIFIKEDGSIELSIPKDRENENP